MENINQIESEMQRAFDRETKRLENIFKISLVGIDLKFSNVKGRYAGQAHLTPEYCSVTLNRDFWISENNVSHVFNETITHEICHIIAYRVWESVGHDRAWKYTMIRAGKKPNRLTTSDCDPVSRKLVSVVIVKCSKCGREWRMTQAKYTRIVNATTRSSCCSCLTNLKKGTIIKTERI